LRYVHSAVAALLPFLRPGDIVAGKSTVPVGTAAEIAAHIVPTGATLVWNPEFLREGWAVQDTVDPDRLVVGIPHDLATAAPTAAGLAAADALREVYHPAVAKGTPFLVMGLET